MGDGDIRSYSLAELKAMRARGETHTDPDAPEYEVDEEFWQNARIVRAGAAEPVRIDPDLLAWFRRGGEGVEARINAALRAWVEAQDRGVR